MSRAARLDAPGALHHIMARGIERRDIFRSDTDRDDLLARLGTGVRDAGARIFAWALLPNHLHAFLRSGAISVSRLMQRVLGGYAREFNRRHHRHGYLFQNRFKSIIVEEHPYLLELLRYIYLNPLRAGLLPDLAALDHYRWCGHSRLMGHRADAWQDVEYVLGVFGERVAQALAGGQASPPNSTSTCAQLADGPARSPSPASLRQLSSHSTLSELSLRPVVA